MNHVEYLLIGGYAVNYHGYPRATVDLDVWISTNVENAHRVEAALRQFGFKAPLEQILDPHTMLRMGVPPLRLEVLKTISGVDFPDCYQSRIEADVDGVPVKIISLADLLRNKKASGRPKDLADIGELPLG